MLRNAVLALWAEPRVPQPPTRVRRDWLLVGALVLTAVLEGSLRDEVVWRPVALVLALALPFTLLWRRTNPLAMVAVTFGADTEPATSLILLGDPASSAPRPSSP